MFCQMPILYAARKLVIAASLMASCFWLATAMPAMAKTSVWLDETTEIRYSSGWYRANGSDENFIDINIRDVDIYERGQQRGFIEKLILKTDGFGQDIVAIENVLIKNFSYTTEAGDTLTIGHISGEHLVAVQDMRIEAYRKRHSGESPLRSLAEIKNIHFYSESEFIELEIANITLDGLLTPTEFDALPDNSRTKLSLDGLVLSQVPGDRPTNETDAIFAMLGSDHLTLDIAMNFQSEKQADTLKLQGIIELSASSLMDMKSDFTLDLSRYEYQALNQLSEYYLETQAPETEEAIIFAFLSSISGFSVNLTDAGLLDLIARLQGDQATDVTIMIMQVSLSDMLPRHALAIGTPIAAFLRQGGTLQMRSDITPRLSPTEMLALQFDPERIIDRIKLKFSHLPQN
ncbi:hypothetical protein OAT45_03535 [Alphaproteobacteria bacterium]|nr:hypothetical protein [Alphaproteobacteria bacterium]